MMLFNDLPNHLLIEILRFLPKEHVYRTVPLVCRRWWRLTQDHRLWTTLSFDETTPRRVVYDFLERAPELRHLVIQNRQDDVMDLLFVASLVCPHVESLSLIRCENVSSNAIERICRKWPMLHSLNLNDSFLGKSDQDACKAIVKFRHLKKLCLRYCRDMEMKSDLPAYLLRSLRSVASVDVEFDHFYDNHLTSLLATRGRHLTSLHLDAANLTDETLRGLEICVNLQELSIVSAESIGDKGIANWLQTMPNLAKLVIANGQYITNEAFANAFKTPSVSNLRHIDLHGCQKLADESLINISHNCRKLSYLDISNTDVTDTGLLMVMHLCKLLRVLTMNDVCYVTGSCLTLLTKNPIQLPFLARLNTHALYPEEEFEDALRLLAKHRPGLRINNSENEQDNRSQSAFPCPLDIY